PSMAFKIKVLLCENIGVWKKKKISITVNTHDMIPTLKWKTNCTTKRFPNNIMIKIRRRFCSRSLQYPQVGLARIEINGPLPIMIPISTSLSPTDWKYKGKKVIKIAIEPYKEKLKYFR